MTYIFFVPNSNNVLEAVKAHFPDSEAHSNSKQGSPKRITHTFNS